MKLEPNYQDVLLEVATKTRALSAGGPRETVTDEQHELEKLEKQLERARTASASAQLAVDDMELEILRIQEDERKLKARERDAKAALGAETDVERRRDFESDRYAAKSRIADLMYELKEAHNEIAALRNNRDVNAARVDDLAAKVEVARRAAEAANEAAPQETPEERIAQLRDALPADALAAFDDRREENEVGAAAFNGRTCGGCFMILPSSDVSRINLTPDNELPECPNCASFLIRTNK